MNSNFKAFVIGDGDAKEEMLKYTSSLNSSDSNFKNAKVIFTSWIKNMDEAIAGLDIVVLTSINEGTPVSLIEAQAASLPVISTDVGGVCDCMLAGKSGILLHDFNPETLANAMFELINDNLKRQQMGKLGRDFVNDKFTYLRLVQDMKILYKELLMPF